MKWNVYLSGEIHTDWRQQIVDGAEALNLPVVFTSAVTNHEASDAAGDLLGPETSNFWRDHKSSKVNAIRTKTLIEKCDVAVVRFGDKYKQWNTAADAGAASALEIPLILVRDPSLTHALKEIDAMASVTVENLEQAADALAYVME